MLSCAAQDISYQLTIFCSQDQDCGSNLKCVITKDFAQSLFWQKVKVIADRDVLLLLTGQMLEVFDITTTAPPQWGYKVQQHHRLYRPVTVTLLFPIRPELKGPWQGEINWLDVDMNISQLRDWPHDMSCSNRSEWGQSTLSVEISQWGWALTSPQSSSEGCGPVRDGPR